MRVFEKPGIGVSKSTYLAGAGSGVHIQGTAMPRQWWPRLQRAFHKLMAQDVIMDLEKDHTTLEKAILQLE